MHALLSEAKLQLPRNGLRCSPLNSIKLPRWGGEQQSPTRKSKIYLLSFLPTPAVGQEAKTIDQTPKHLPPRPAPPPPLSQTPKVNPGEEGGEPKWTQQSNGVRALLS